MSLLSAYPTLQRLLQELKHLDEEKPKLKKMSIRSGRDVHRVDWPGLGSFWLNAAQHKVVLILAEAFFQSASPDVPQQTLIAASGMRAVRLSEVFEGSNAWNTLILPGKSGTYRLPDLPITAE